MPAEVRALEPEELSRGIVWIGCWFLGSADCREVGKQELERLTEPPQYPNDEGGSRRARKHELIEKSSR